MKNTILLFMIAVSGNLLAQAPPAPPVPPGPPVPSEAPKHERMESMRIAFLTQKLDLTPEEAQKFWPVYNEFHKRKEEMARKRRQETKGTKEKLDSLNDKQVETLIDGEIAFKQRMLDLEKEYHAKFKSVLPIKKVARLYKAEEQFTRKLLDHLAGKDGEKGRHGKGGHKGGKDWD